MNLVSDETNMSLYILVNYQYNVIFFFQGMPKISGVFGKVLVEHVDEYGNCEIMFDFNLCKVCLQIYIVHWVD